MSTIAAHKSKDVANWFLAWIFQINDTFKMDSVKLQKIVYLARGYSVPYLGYSLFDEPYIAMEKGPVATSLYPLYEKIDHSDVQLSIDFDFNIFSAEENKFLFSIWTEFGFKQAEELVNIAHSHSIWENAYNQKVADSDKKIDNEQIDQFFLHGLYQPIKALGGPILG